MACHTFGKGVKVGPDLKGVNERRQRPWLLKFIRSSQSVIDSGDAIAVDLFQQFKQQRMPDWIDLSEAQIGSILDWLAINGPDQREPDERLADTASAAEIASGRALFHGDRALVHGGTACASCHSIREDGSRTGGSLAFDLTDTYSHYQDAAMTVFLKHPCVQRLPESATPKFLAPEESFALKAYLRHCALGDQATGARGATAVAKSVDGKGPDGSAGGTAANPAAPDTKRVVWAPRTAQPGPPASRAARIEADLLFLAFPYAALLVLLIGVVIRYVLSQRQPEGVRTAASAAWQLFSGGPAWRIGIAVTAALHLLGLLVPRAIVAWNGVPIRLYILEGSGFLLGAVALAGWVQMMRRHFGRVVASARATLSEIADCVLLSLLCTAIVSGLATALLYRWGSSWSASTLAPYMQSLARGAPAIQLIETMPFLVRLHVLSWFAVIALVPFTSAALILVSLLDRGVMMVARPITGAARGGRRVLERLSPARWLWPEEDAIDIPGKPDNAQKPS